MLVLVVDDERELAELIVDALQCAGIDGIIAANGAEALRAVATHPVDFVLSDVQMPVLDGVALLQRLQATHPHLPVALMTGSSGKARLDMGQAVALFSKPFELDTLVALMSRYDRSA